MTQPRCPTADRLMVLYYDIPTPELGRQLADHRRNCPTCQAYYRELTEQARRAVHPEMEEER
jgi:hypothetical protein